MSDTGQDHTRFEQLAAGHALDALDQGEEQEFLAHARQCPLCRQALTDYAEVAAALAETAPAAEPSPELGARIVAAAMADSTRQDSPDAAVTHPVRRVSPLRRSTRWRMAAVVSAAAAVIGGGIWAGLTASDNGPAPPLAACAHPAACAEILLTGASTRLPAGRVIISGGSAWLVPAAGLPADDTARQIYVLWQVTASGSPRAVGAFDVAPGAGQPIRVGALAVPYHVSKAFAVSLEPGRTIPASPSRIVAAGPAPGQS